MQKPTDAIENLRNSQRQLDADGCHVGVSRQALEETLEWTEWAYNRIVKLEKEVDRLVADGFSNSGPTRADAVYRLMSEAHDFREVEVWLAAWDACEKSQLKP